MPNGALINKAVKIIFPGKKLIRLKSPDVIDKPIATGVSPWTKNR